MRGSEIECQGGPASRERVVHSAQVTIEKSSVATRASMQNVPMCSVSLPSLGGALPHPVRAAHPAKSVIKLVLQPLRYLHGVGPIEGDACETLSDVSECESSR